MRPPREAHCRHPSDMHDSAHDQTRNKRECWRVWPVAAPQRPVPLCTYLLPISCLPPAYLSRVCAAYLAPESQPILHHCRMSRCTRIAGPAIIPVERMRLAGRFRHRALVGAPGTGRMRPPKVDAHQANRERRVNNGWLTGKHRVTTGIGSPGRAADRAGDYAEYGVRMGKSEECGHVPLSAAIRECRVNNGWLTGKHRVNTGIGSPAWSAARPGGYTEYDVRMGKSEEYGRFPRSSAVNREVPGKHRVMPGNYSGWCQNQGGRWLGRRGDALMHEEERSRRAARHVRVWSGRCGFCRYGQSGFREEA